MTKRQYWNPEWETSEWRRVEQWQATRLAQVLPAVRRRSRLYKHLYREVPSEFTVHTLEDLAALPFTVKEDLRLAQQNGSDQEPLGANQAVPRERIIQVVSSSGTTGQPLYYALTEHDAHMFAEAIANTWYTAGVRPGDIVAHLVGLPMVAGGLPYADGLRRIGATLCWLGGFPTERILREMHRLRVGVALATTSFGLHISEKWADVGRETGVPSALQRILCGGEPGLSQEDVRARIRAGLGASEVREVMGLGDVIPAMWSECEACDGMHFNAQRYVAIELIDPASGERREWKEGAAGELVYTTLERDATPVLRYRSRDHVLVTGAASCRCGRTSPRIRCVGRSDDMLIYKGMNVFPTAIRELVWREFVESVGASMRIWKDRKDQVRFDSPIAVDIEVSPVVSPEQYFRLTAAIEDEVRAQLQVRIAVTLVPAGTLPQSTYKNSLIAVRG